MMQYNNLKYAYTDLLAGTKLRRCSWPQAKLKWRSTSLSPLWPPTWWSNSLISMRITRHLQKPCSVPAAAPLSLPTLEFVATVERMCISVISAGTEGLDVEMCFRMNIVQKPKKRTELHWYWGCNCLFWIFQVHQLWRKGPIPVQCLWFL